MQIHPIKEINDAAKSTDTNQQEIQLPMTRLLVVGDQPAVRKGLLMRLAAERDFSVVCEATEGKSIMDLAGSFCPDVVLIDLDKLRIDGIATVKTLHSICPQASIILLSMYDDLLTSEQARNAGAAAFVAKSLPTDTLLATIRQVAR
jgi:DNA-binding NarL/FixJ family response regulator